MNKLKKSVVAAGLTAGLIGGGAAGAILGSAGVSGAQETTTTAAPATDAPADVAERPDPTARYTETLAPLVADGTITQAQADAVIAALAAAAPSGGGGHGGPGGRGGPGGGMGSEAAATALGITADELRQAVTGGQTIAQVAESNGVDVQTVIDAMVAERAAELNEKLAAGEITQADADQKLADATTRITDEVNNGRPAGGPGGVGGPGGIPKDAPLDTPSADDAVPAS